ncbi:hypothetical protein Psta_0013 [Pirellula staleyi DSM 6068]|uniref:STAS domain-containing protein n=1 Tax=Pirellula staleyi (strain ATCC 27377 / DSM 6068 / ICPB 4128) TaxID=530564 RepID=D2QZF2_PIRSD|nr:hypothetical protein [Pirellula staleyi]ADB14710.1 hypothetical protein Psta_0013 [Pirellula staleyi DSM 6068]
MMVQLAPGWSMELDRGPDWLFVRVIATRQGDTGEIALADAVWDSLEQAFTHRLVLELDDLVLLRSWMVGQLVLLHKRVTTKEGTMRIAGLSDANQLVLRMMRLEERFPQYQSRSDAVMGHRPLQPR